MYKRQVKNNINTLKKIGVTVLSPQSGKLACRTEGKGKLMDVGMIVENLNLFFSEKKLKGKNAIVTAGPSIEKIDPIRFIGNFSSGLQGYEIAETLSFFGAKTTLIRKIHTRACKALFFVYFGFISPNVVARPSCTEDPTCRWVNSKCISNI